jgi:L-amino acid N-acyltransferase YncA
MCPARTRRTASTTSSRLERRGDRLADGAVVLDEQTRTWSAAAAPLVVARRRGHVFGWAAASATRERMVMCVERDLSFRESDRGGVG